MGDCANAGTKASVYVIINGKTSSTGKRHLYRSLNNDTAFEQGQVDDFIIEAVDLGPLVNIIVGHDGRQPGSGMFLEHVIITLEDSNELCFNCHRYDMLNVSKVSLYNLSMF